MSDLQFAPLANAGALIREHACGGAGTLPRLMVVADGNAAKFHLRKLSGSLGAAGFGYECCIVPSGEESKSVGGLARLWGEFHMAKITRSDLVVAFGGGVTGDLAGFAAATWLRGVPIVQIPTTLLAMVDSSIGGKTAIDLPSGKNLAGAFHRPRLVVIDTSLLDTLPPEVFSEGMAEIIKYGCVFDDEMFDDTSNREIENLKGIIRRCVQIKSDIVSRDEFDRGERMLLNFGHTFGHAVEKVAGYADITHGEAVAIGMVAAARFGEQTGFTKSGTSGKIAAAVAAHNLPSEIPPHLGKHAICDAMLSDKKILSGKINLVLLERIGSAKIVPVEPDGFAADFTL